MDRVMRCEGWVEDGWGWEHKLSHNLYWSSKCFKRLPQRAPKHFWGGPEGRGPKGTTSEPKGSPKGARRQLKGSRKGAKREPKRSPRAAQRKPKGKLQKVRLVKMQTEAGNEFAPIRRDLSFKAVGQPGRSTAPGKPSPSPSPGEPKESQKRSKREPKGRPRSAQNA